MGLISGFRRAGPCCVIKHVAFVQLSDKPWEVFTLTAVNFESIFKNPLRVLGRFSFNFQVTHQIFDRFNVVSYSKEPGLLFAKFIFRELHDAR